MDLAEAVAQIDEPIKSFPKPQSHYCRSNNQNRYCLSPELNETKLYRLYLAKYEPEQYELYEDGKSLNLKASDNFYFRHFNSSYDISFIHSRSDTKNAKSWRTI